MTESPDPVPLRFWRSISGREPVREWLNDLPLDDRRVIGRDMAKVQFGWLADGVASLSSLAWRIVGSALIAAKQTGSPCFVRLS